MIDLDKEIELTDKLIYEALSHFKKCGTDYAKSVGRDLDLNKRDACKILKSLFQRGYLEKRGSGMLKRKEAKLKKRVVTQPHHTYYVLSEKGEEFLKEFENKRIK